jgi:hypothetical protein
MSTLYWVLIMFIRRRKKTKRLGLSCAMLSSSFASLQAKVGYASQWFIYFFGRVMLPCCAGYVTLLCRLCHPVVQAMLSGCAGYVTMLCYWVGGGELKNKANHSQDRARDSLLGLSLAIPKLVA